MHSATATEGVASLVAVGVLKLSLRGDLSLVVEWVYVGFVLRGARFDHDLSRYSLVLFGESLLKQARIVTRDSLMAWVAAARLR